MKFLIIGLGNIGPEYADTRHNAGFMVLDAYAQKHKANWHPDKFANYTEVNHKGRKLILLKPTTYMNLSGKTVRHWTTAEKVPLENVLIIVDELAIPFGALRLKAKGSDAGHNGLKNINELMGTQNYPRLRFGVGDNFPKGGQVNYVLSGFTDEEQKQLPELIDKSIAIIEDFVTIGIDRAMNTGNTK